VSHHDDADGALLARLARSRDARAFDTLYRRHTSVLYATALRVMRDTDSAADVVHDAWVVAAEHAGRFEGRSSFRTWITGIVMNLIRERARRDRRDGRRAGQNADGFDDADITSWAPDQGTSWPPADVLGVDPIDLDAAIAALPLRFRQVLVLHDVEGFTHEEIAVMLGIVAGTSKSQLARARQRVREHLTDRQPRSAR
jgi:RNA polymerase sigma-70 factor (ECF subfamily)